MKPTKIAAAVSVVGLLAFAPAALANTAAIVFSQTSPLSWTGSFNQTHGSANGAPVAFDDLWTFNLPAGPVGGASGTAIASFGTTGVPTTNFTLGQFVDLTTNTVIASTGSNLGFYNLQFTPPNALNTTNNYGFRVVGTTVGGGGSYGGTVSVSAVPEPGSYALFLAGLGIMGAIVRRRTTKA